MDAVYANLWTAHGDEFATLDQSLGLRSGTFLFDVARAADLGSQSIVADIGYGRGNHCFELARRFGCRFGRRVSQQHLEASFQSAGFTVSWREQLDSELIEFYEEREGRASRELMRIG